MNRNSGLALEVLGWSTANGATVNRYAYANAPNQQWQFTPLARPALPPPQQPVREYIHLNGRVVAIENGNE